MDTTAIASVATDMKLNQVQVEASTKVLKQVMNMESAIAEDLTTQLANLQVGYAPQPRLDVEV